MRADCPLVLLSLGSSALLVVACGGGDDAPGVDADPIPNTADAAPNAPDSSIPGEWETLIEGDWTIPAGQEGYRCVRRTFDEDTYIHAFDYTIPLGTHHTVLSVGEADQPDGTTTCNAGVNHAGAIGGSGVGTLAYTLPPGVAMKVEAGQQLLLNLHLFNTTDDPMSNTSGVKFQRISESEVEHVAELVLMGRFSLFIPAGEHTLQGVCNMNGDVNLVSVTPHMHQLGTHMKVVARRAESGDLTLHDDAYNFEEQITYPFDEIIPMKQGDQIVVDCTYDNYTGDLVTFGESSEQEMCFASMVRYPALGGDNNTIFCATN